MGIKYLSKKFKAAANFVRSWLLNDNKDCEDPNAPATLINPKVEKKKYGVDLSVFLHKALGNVISAAEFQMVPKIPISKVDEVCLKLISLARQANIELVICTDGRYHKYKDSVNQNRKIAREDAQARLDALLLSDDPNIADVKRWMKKAVYVREDILAQAVEVFKDNKVEVYGAITEADFQLAYWELTKFTDGTISVDSDIFALGSKFFVDDLKVDSKDGNCFIIERDEVWKANAFSHNSSKWSDDDLLVFAILSGCDWLPRLYNLKSATIEEIMDKWIVAETEEEKDKLLNGICNNRYWPKGGGDAGKGKSNRFPREIQHMLQFYEMRTGHPHSPRGRC